MTACYCLSEKKRKRLLEAKVIFDHNMLFLTRWHYQSQPFSFWSSIIGINCIIPGLSLIQIKKSLDLGCSIARLERHANAICSLDKLTKSDVKPKGFIKDTCESLHQFAESVQYPLESVYCDRLME